MVEVRRCGHGAGMGRRPDFPIVFLGYDPGEVDEWLRRADEVGGRSGRRQRRDVAALGEPAFHVRLRGYARRPVDAFVMSRWAELNR